MSADLSLAEWRYIQRYIDELAREMGLREWRIYLDAATGRHGEAGAMCWPAKARAGGRIRVQEGFRWLKPEVQRHFLTHELTHFITADWHHHYNADGAWSVVEERAIDHLALLIAPRLPLPQWPKRARVSTPNDPKFARQW